MAATPYAVQLCLKGLILLCFFVWSSADDRPSEPEIYFDFPRVYSAVVPRQHKEVAQQPLIAEVDLLKITKLMDTGTDGVYAEISFIVHSQNHLDYLVELAHGSDNATSPHRGAINMEIDFAATKDLIAKMNLVKIGDGRKLQTYSTISGFPCYRDLAGIELLMIDLVTLGDSIPNLSVSLIDIGDSYLKTQNVAQGHDIWALKITGNGVQARGMTTEKGVLFAMMGIHPREYSPPELGARWAEALVNGYGNDAEITAMLDHTEIHLVLQSNPDVRHLEETEPLLRRKNLNPSSAGTQCGPADLGVDLNRNFPFMWGLRPGSSSFPCSAVFNGANPASEPEVEAIVDYASSLYPLAQRKNDPEAQVNTSYPETTTGIFLDIHSFGEVIIFPWGYVEQRNPNKEGMNALLRKYTTFNNYDFGGPNSDFFYPASGATDDWAYGTLGAMAMTFELGTEFYEGCSNFEQKIAPANLPVLTYAAKVARLPYSLPKGPDVINVTVSPPTISTSEGSVLVVTALASDSILSSGSFRTSRQTIASARLFVDTHPYDLDVDGNAAEGIPMTGSFGSVTEPITATLTISQVLSGIYMPVVGRHSIFIQATDSDGYIGPVTAAYFDVALEPSSPPTKLPVAPPTTVPTANISQLPSPSVSPSFRPSVSPTLAPTVFPTDTASFPITEPPIQSSAGSRSYVAKLLVSHILMITLF